MIHHVGLWEKLTNKKLWNLNSGEKGKYRKEESEDYCTQKLREYM